MDIFQNLSCILYRDILQAKMYTRPIFCMFYTQIHSLSDIIFERIEISTYITFMYGIIISELVVKGYAQCNFDDVSELVGDLTYSLSCCQIQ